VDGKCLARVIVDFNVANKKTDSKVSWISDESHFTGYDKSLVYEP
jgi:hypothetical protein